MVWGRVGGGLVGELLGDFDHFLSLIQIGLFEVDLCVLKCARIDDVLATAVIESIPRLQGLLLQRVLRIIVRRLHRRTQLFSESFFSLRIADQILLNLHRLYPRDIQIDLQLDILLIQLIHLLLRLWACAVVWQRPLELAEFLVWVCDF